MLVSNRNLHVSTRWMLWEGPTAPEISPTAPLGVQQIDEGLPFGVAQGAGQAIFASASSAPTNTMRIPTDIKKIQKGVRKGGWNSTNPSSITKGNGSKRYISINIPLFPLWLSIIIHKYPMNIPWFPLWLYQVSACQQPPQTRSQKIWIPWSKRRASMLGSGEMLRTLGVDSCHKMNVINHG